MNACILVSSAGRRVGLIECFRRAARSLDVDLRVVAVDLNPSLSSACTVADKAYAVPRVDAPGYVDRLLEIAALEGVDLLVPTIDPELLPLSRAADRFAAQGTRVHVSAPPVIEIVRDKSNTAAHLGAAGIEVPRTMPLDELRRDPSHLPWPVFVKPVNGSASRGLQVVETAADLPPSFDEAMVAQQLLRGDEYTVNVFVSHDGVLRSVVPHKRLSVRAGEVEKGLTFRSRAFDRLAQAIVDALPGVRGAICFQLIDDEAAGPSVIEINARFGGGYPLADEAGACFAKWLLAEITGAPAEYHDDWREGILMLRYDAAVFCNPAEVR